MISFVKLFGSILDSSVWQQPATTKVVWITLLAMSDKGGDVTASIPGLAARAGVTLEECQKALEYLQTPDPFSRTKEDEGRRIKEITGGWLIINHPKYRELVSKEIKRENDNARYHEKKGYGAQLISAPHKSANFANSAELAHNVNVDDNESSSGVEEVQEEEGVDLDLQSLFDEWYDRGGPTKKDGTPFRENFGNFQKAFRRKGCKLVDFAEKVHLRLKRFDVDDREDRSFKLGMLLTFLNGPWRDEKGPPKKVAPLAKKVADPAQERNLPAD
jgi:hypothetical protein